jgi:hypothetical protein
MQHHLYSITSLLTMATAQKGQLLKLANGRNTRGLLRVSILCLIAGAAVSRSNGNRGTKNTIICEQARFTVNKADIESDEDELRAELYDGIIPYDSITICMQDV